MEVVEGYEVSLLTDQDVVPDWPRGGGEVRGQVPGDQTHAESHETVQDRVARVLRHCDGDLEIPEELLVLLRILLAWRQEVKEGRTVREERASQPPATDLSIVSVEFS